MCGIVGFTHLDRKAPPDRIQAATATLTHRGPDQQGVWESNGVSLGAVRLKIIDLASSQQPMISQDGKTILAFNGEIYNHKELRRELEALGHRFQTQGDTEVVLQAFLQWDTASFARLRGMFAIALWSEAERRLVLARDRMGIKPLYCSRSGSDLYFGSELKAILIHPEIERNLDLQGLDDFLSLNYVPGPRTLLAGVTKLQPGCFLEWRDGTIRIQPYWELAFPISAQWTMDSAAEALDSLLHEAVREHLVSEVPLGVWISGGVDSSAILHYAAAHSRSRLKTFSVSFRGRSFDETRYISQVVARFDTEHYEFDLNPQVDLEGAIREFAYYSDEPSADAGALPVWFLAKMSRQHVTVTLSGEGADELFGGYLTYRANHWARIARRFPAWSRRAVLAALRAWPVSDEKISFEYKLKRFLQGSLLPPDEAHFYWNGTFSEREKRSLLQRETRPGPARLFAAASGAPPPVGLLNRSLWLDQRVYLPDDILYKVDRMSMAHSLEVRPPFLDHRIVEFAATLPENLKIQGERQKAVLKHLMRDKLPLDTLRRKKMGFDIPAHEWFRGPLRPLLLETLSQDALSRSGLFAAATVQSLIREHLERRANLGYHLWGLLILMLWIQRWKVRVSPGTPTSSASA